MVPLTLVVLLATNLSHRPVEVLWRDPGPVEKLDFAGGPGGRSHAPQGPFTFLKEELGGTSPKIRVTDAKGVTWIAKWGPEVHAEVFTSRLAWAAGYFVMPNYYVASGKIIGAKGLTRAKGRLDRDGNFKESRFKLKEPKKLQGHDWAFINNPFIGTKELNGLKILLMLTSNWDSKDARNVEQAGSNTAIWQDRVNGRRELHYAFTDWGATMGKWGLVLGNVVIANQWDCKGYTAQSAEFVTGLKNGVVQWGYKGHQAGDVTSGITVSDVRWLLRYIGRISDRQLRAGLEAAGANPEEVECFTKALRNRIEQLQRVAATTATE